MKHEIVDVDSHVQEPADTWTKRMSKQKWGDRIPQLREIDAADRMPMPVVNFFIDPKPKRVHSWTFYGELASPYPSTCHAVMPDRETLPARWEDVPRSVYDANERLKAMDQDGVDAQVLFPNGGLGSPAFGKEPDFEAAYVRAYNDMLVEEFSSISSRFIPLSQLPFSDIESTVSELRYATERGHRGFLMLSAPHQKGMPHMNSPYWDPLWAAAQEMQVPAHLHGGGGAIRMWIDPKPGISPRFSRAFSGTIGFNLQAQFMSNLLFSGIFERFPGLTFVVAESGIGWVPYVLEMCDHEWERCQLARHGHPIKPSDLFRQHCYVDFWYEQKGLAYRHLIGVDRIMWESDFPHPTSIWPESRRYIDASLEGVPDDERDLILWGNAKRVYHLE